MISAIVIRPQPACDTTVTEMQALGIEAHGFPLFAVEPVAWSAPPAGSFDALLLGSANALRHGGAQLARYAGKPAYVVGATTAEAARSAGLDVIVTGSGGLQPVLDAVRPEHSRLLRLAGEERIALDQPAAVSIAERIVYASQPLPMPEALRVLLQERAVILLHSAEAGRHFAGECDRLGLERAQLSLATIGPRVAMAAGGDWAALEIAETTDGTALLALARRMCEDRQGS